VRSHRVTHEDATSAENWYDGEKFRQYGATLLAVGKGIQRIAGGREVNNKDEERQ
jgi:hypothetical protein